MSPTAQSISHILWQSDSLMISHPAEVVVVHYIAIVPIRSWISNIQSLRAKHESFDFLSSIRGGGYW